MGHFGCDCVLICERSSLRYRWMGCGFVRAGCVSVSADDENSLYLQLSQWLPPDRALRGLFLRGTCDARDGVGRGRTRSLSSLFDFLWVVSVWPDDSEGRSTFSVAISTTMAHGSRTSITLGECILLVHGIATAGRAISVIISRSPPTIRLASLRRPVSVNLLVVALSLGFVTTTSSSFSHLLDLLVALLGLVLDWIVDFVVVFGNDRDTFHGKFSKVLHLDRLEWWGGGEGQMGSQVAFN